MRTVYGPYCSSTMGRVIPLSYPVNYWALVLEHKVIHHVRSTVHCGLHGRHTDLRITKSLSIESLPDSYPFPVRVSKHAGPQIEVTTHTFISTNELAAAKLTSHRVHVSHRLSYHSIVSQTYTYFSCHTDSLFSQNVHYILHA